MQGKWLPRRGGAGTGAPPGDMPQLQLAAPQPPRHSPPRQDRRRSHRLYIPGAYLLLRVSNVNEVPINNFI